MEAKERWQDGQTERVDPKTTTDENGVTWLYFLFIPEGVRY